jgi:hypothetical protein
MTHPLPSIEDHQSKSTEQGHGTTSETGPEREAVQADDELHARDPVKTAQEQEQTSETANCTFSGDLVPIDLKRFTVSGINLVECPDCGRMRRSPPLEVSSGSNRTADASNRKTLVGHQKNRLGCCRRVDPHLKSRGVVTIAGDIHAIR